MISYNGKWAWYPSIDLFTLCLFDTGAYTSNSYDVWIKLWFEKKGYVKKWKSENF